MFKKLVLSLALCLTFVSQVNAQSIPYEMPFQGFLADLNGQPLNRAVGLTFKLYASANDAVPVWTETLANVPVQNGAFSVNLGLITPIKDALANASAKYISISIDGQADSPKQELGSVPYAFMAYNASRLEGRSASDFPTEAQVRQWISENIANVVLNNNGNGVDLAAINNLIESKGYLNAAAVQALIDLAINALTQRVVVLENNQANVQNLQNQVNALTAQVQNLQNQVNALNALNAQIQNLQAQITQLQNNQNNNVAAAPVEIVGISATTTGRVSFNGKNGIQGASELCKTAFANSHACSVSEAHVALSTDRYPRNLENQATWIADPTINADLFLSNTAFAAGNGKFCQSLQYNSGDVATGTSMFIKRYTSNGGGGGIESVHLVFNQAVACGTQLPILCCK
jgi:hypothetical protein